MLDHNPRKEFDAAVEYAISVARVYLSLLKDSCGHLSGLRILEIGPGADFAPQLVLASAGAKVTLADKFLAKWDRTYHPEFYRTFLDKWDGPSDALRAVLKKDTYAGVIETLNEPAENMRSLPNGHFDLVQSNAVLEHVSDFGKVARELARVTKPGGLHTHQVDFRDHRDFSRPLGYLQLDQVAYAALREKDGGNHGIQKRMPELIDAFSPYFWVWKVACNSFADDEHVSEVMKGLPEDSPYSYWPTQLLREVCGRVWFVRKSPNPSFLSRWFNNASVFHR